MGAQNYAYQMWDILLQTYGITIDLFVLSFILVPPFHSVILSMKFWTDSLQAVHVLSLQSKGSVFQLAWSMAAELWSVCRVLQAGMVHELPHSELALWRYSVSRRAILLISVEDRWSQKGNG